MGPLTAIVGTRLYLDANIVIYAAEGPHLLPNAVREALDRIDRAELSAVTSELTLAEVLVRPLRDRNAVLVDSYRRRLTAGPTLDVQPVSRAVLSQAAALRAAQNSIKLPDAIHAATAMLAGCSTFLTNDTRFVSIPDLPVLLLSALT
jgi:predicted nucleic acid-binding protein